jgi:hypothetical protein
MTAADYTIVSQIFYDDDWHDVIARYKGGGGQAIKIFRGRRPDAAGLNPASVELAIDNTNGLYSPRNAASSLFGKIGVNTPLRVAIKPNATEGVYANAIDSFTRSVTAGWGSSTNGGAWTNTGAGGTVAASDFDVNGTKGTHYVPVANAYRFSYLNQIACVDCTQAVTYTCPTPTGAALEPANLMFHGVFSPASYALFRVSISTGNAITLSAYAIDGTLLGSTAVALTHNAANSYRLKVRKYGKSFFGKVWNVAGAEPSTWDVHFTDTTTGVARVGWTGVRSGRAASNTNTTDPQFTYDDYELTVEVPMASTEIPDWPSTWDTTGTDSVVNIEGAGITRRLSQGSNKPIDSPLKRALIASNPVAYWPMETGTTNETSSALVGGQPLRSSDYQIQYDSDSPIGSHGAIALPLVNFPSVEVNDLGGLISTGDITGDEWQISFWFRGNDTTVGGFALAITVVCTLGQITISINDPVDTTEGIGGTIFETSSGSSATIGNDSSGALLDGEWHFARVELESLASDTNFTFYVDGVSRTTGTSTLALGFPKAAYMPSSINDLDDLSVAHFAIHNGYFSTDLYEIGTGFVGETAADRMARICSAANIPFSLIGDAADTEPMGPQPLGTTLEILAQCIRTDGGSFYEPAEHLGYQYRTRVDLINQTVLAELDYDEKHFSSIPIPAPGDYGIRNFVVVENDDGLFATYEITTGRLSTSPPPPDGTGVGLYDDTINANPETSSELKSIAQWVAHSNTVETPRFPTVKINLARAPFVESQSLTDSLRSIDVNGSLISLANLPVYAGASEVDVLNIGIDHELDQFEHIISFNTIPADVYSNILIWQDGSANSLYKWDTSYSTTNASFISGTNTSLSVATETGRKLWVTGSGSPQFPIYVVTSGVILQVTAISGATSPQTFTVVQTPINGINKTIPAGEQIRLAYPKRWAR